ncbi:MAG TPA: hypothetical protein DCQ25_09100 [Elusimicrobia bacterium]|nr:hypothetical protein [Elusimicrobiota bacterium]
MLHRNALAALLALAAAAPAAGGTAASIFYFDHSYRITSGLSESVEEVIKSSASLKLEKVLTELTYTNGDTFLLEGPEDLNARELNATTSYALTEEADAIDGAFSIALPPPGLAETTAAALRENLSPYREVEVRRVQLLRGVSPAGIRFRALRAPWRAAKPLWEPTLRSRLLASAGERLDEFAVFSIPTGLDGINRRMVEEGADKRTAVMLSLGAGGTLAGAVMKAGPARTFEYMRAAGTDIAALEPEDLSNFKTWARAGLLKVSTAAPEFICTNLRITDPELAGLVKPYAVREIGGIRTGFISLVRAHAPAELAGSPFEVWDPRDEKALYRVIDQLRAGEKVKAVVAVSFLKSGELGWLLNFSGIDVLIGPKAWDTESGRSTRVVLRGWEKETHTGPALTVFPDAGGAGVIRLERGPKGSLAALESTPPPEDGREPVFYREQLYMKERIASYFMGSGDSVLPDLRARGGYTIHSFFNLAAALLRRQYAAEAAIVRVKPFSSRVPGEIPSSMVRTWLGPDEPMALALVPGFHLSELLRSAVPEGSDAEAYLGAEYLAVSGLDKSGRLGGLPIVPSETYLTALPAGLTEGKPFVKVLKRPEGAAETLHGAVLGALQEIKDTTPSRLAWEEAVLEAARNVTPPRSVWRLNLRNLSAQMVDTGVRAPGGYDQVNESRISAADQTQMQGSARLFSEFYSESFRLDVGVSADYGKTVLRPKDQPRLTTESVDQLIYSGELVYRWRKFDGRLGKLVAGPYASAAYDTEFARSGDLPLRKVLRGGAGLKLFEGAALQELYAGLSTEQVYTYLPARTKHALETGFRLEMPLPGTALRLSADGNYRLFARSRYDTAADLKERLELNLRLSTRLYGDVMISPFLNFFLASGKKLPGSATNLTTGFALEYSRLFKLKR